MTTTRSTLNAEGKWESALPRDEPSDECQTVAAQHTPGPWLYRPHEYDDWGVVRAGHKGGWFVAQASAGRKLTDEEAAKHRADKTDPFEGNARLICAAPDLLAACKAALNMVEGDGFPPDWDFIRAAIAKATQPVASRGKANPTHPGVP